MNILECEIEELLFNNLKDKDLLRSRGFHHFEQHYYLHPNFGSYGIPDIIGVTVYENKDFNCKSLSATIYELKKELINIDTFLQAIRYARAIDRIVEKNDDFNISEVDIKIVLIGKKVDLNSDFIYISDLFPKVHFLTYSIDISKGLLFKNHFGYCITNEKPFDLEKYISDFNDGILNADEKQNIPF